MLNKLRQMIRRYDMLQQGDHLICAVSGGADSVAMLFAFYLLRDKMQISLSAAHFNHRLRGTESDRDEAFVRQLCDRLDIPLYVGSGNVVAGKKGLEAAAREARYAFLKTLPGKIATAHTANDNLETVLMHLVRGTGLKGLGGITPINDFLIRPMLAVTRSDVLAFLSEYNLSYVMDSSNSQDRFLRNRLRRNVVPLLEKENPNLASNVSALAQSLRHDELVLQELSLSEDSCDVLKLREMKPSLRSRVICEFLRKSGVHEPESKHICGVEKLIFSNRPSACTVLQDGIVITRNYNRLESFNKTEKLQTKEIHLCGETVLTQTNLKIICSEATDLVDETDRFTVVPFGKLWVRHRLPGDRMRLRGGSKELKRIYIDRKIPASRRLQIPVIVDEKGVVAVYGIGANRDRLSVGKGSIEIRFVCEDKKEGKSSDR